MATTKLKALQANDVVLDPRSTGYTVATRELSF
jgi:hypothetical protein